MPADPKKTIDLPPHGPRNPDPITDQPGSHPIEAGIGAAVGGAASGLAVGSVGGPVAAVIGAIVGGAAAGGLAGKGVGELIDPTTEDNWLREYFAEHKRVKADLRKADDAAFDASSLNDTDEHPDRFRTAYQYGLAAGRANSGLTFDDVEADLRAEWERDYRGRLPWPQAAGAVRHAFNRASRLGDAA